MEIVIEQGITIPTNHWLNEFSQNGNETLVKVTITCPDAKSLKQMVDMGFKEGFAIGHNNLNVSVITLLTDTH